MRSPATAAAAGDRAQLVTEVWAQLLLAEADQARIRDFLVSTIGISPKSVARRMHLTVYHSRRPMPGVLPRQEAASVLVPVHATRFMVMAPGGENPRPEHDPARRKVGFRVQRASPAFVEINRYRDALIEHETDAVLGRRAPSGPRRNAFGARHFQPHVAVLRAGSGIDRDLSKLGTAFRDALTTLTFDRYIVEITRKAKG